MGRVVLVRDGDTVDVRGADGATKTVRLFGVDCPEYGQSFGSEAKSFTRSICANRLVAVEVVEVDQYGRIVGLVTLENGSVLNEEIIASGHGWWYRRYAAHRQDYEVLERHARDNRLGLWAQETPQPPWSYRKQHRKSSQGR